MDIVDTFNHLIPSDQLDDSLLIGQNLECEASNEFGTGLLLEDSLKNMLSDKDPMFGSASSQFNPLDNDDSNFLVAGSTGLNVATTRGLSGELTSAQTTPVKRPVGRPRKYPRLSPCETIGEASSGTPASTKPRGRPGRKPTNRQLSSFLIEKGVRGSQLKKELAQGGRVNINDIDAGLWLNPVVVLRRLTVTVGGFRIELLPGPSYDTGNADVDQSVSFGDAFTYSGDVAYAMLPDDKVKTQDPTPENPGGSDVGEGCGAEDVPLGLGPYVNPNDVQAANKSPAPNSCSEKTIVDDESISEKEKPAAKGKDAIKEPQNLKNDKCGSTNKIKIDSQEKQKITPKALPKSKQGLPTVKDKSLVSFRPNSLIKGLKTLQNAPSKLSQKEDVHHAKSLKEKKGTEALKRPGEKTQPEHASKVQKIQTGKPVSPKPKLPGPSSSVVKKTLSSDGHTEQQDLPKHPPSHNPKPEQAPPALGSPGHSSKTPEDGGQEKPKGKKTDKFLQKQKSKNARSISVEEPQLFVPDNAPAAKKESADERPANSETVWDGSNSCGLCKKHHNNVFMVGCGRCDEWFHGDCVGLDLAKVREMEDEDQMYVCLKCCAEESTKVEPDTQSAAKPEGQANLEVLDNKAPAKQRQGPTQALTSGGVRPMKKESDRRQSTEVKDPVHKTGVHPKQETRSKGSSAAPKKPASVDEIRRSVRDSLKEILLQRLKESDLKVPTERASEVAKKTERELFHLYKDTDSKYKSKYRSLMFNLKDSKNNVLFRRVLKGDISPGNLIRMSPEELASKELAAWRQRENRHTIEMIEKEQREAERRPITKITHKGEIEIESEEPVKAAETVEDPPALKVPEVPDELIPLEKNPDSVKIEKDTTALHKSHLFDLHCKICTGRMAPPVEEATTKVVKVATTVVRRQSAATEETKSAAPPRKEEDLHLAVLEESLRSATSSRHEGRSTFAAGKEDSVAFLNNLTSMWRGFVNMPAVAKLVIKAFPVSGVLDNLTEDLPDSIQVGGRISPQTVWDYFEKIRATGTKEVCLIRFSPETEEDAISYTLLYAYFSSRKRFGVVSNNLKRVKDMYIIPLGATEKVPHQLVPFDGPGLENNRSNLLLGLIIRQRPKRDFLPVDVNETAAIIPEAKPLTLSTNSARATEEEEKLYLSSLTPAKTTKETDKLISAVKEEDEPILESVEEESVIEDGQGPESNKPLRFLPGVLVGWGGELPPLPDFGAKGTPAPDDSPKTKADSTAPGSSAKSPTAVLPRMDRFVIKKKEPKPGNVAAGPPDASSAQNTSGKDVAKEATWQGGGISLKDKPPDVSTEAFLAGLSASPSGKEATAAVSGKKEDAGVLTETEKGITKGTLSSPSKSQAEADHAKSTKLPLSGILKKSCVYSPVGEAQASQPASLSPQPVPMFSSAQNHVTSAPPLQGLQLPHAMDEPGIVIPGIGCSPSREDPIASQASAMATDATCPPPVQRPQAAGEAPELAATGAATVLAPPQEPGKYGDSSGHPLEEVQTPPVQQQNNSAPRAAYNSPVTSHVPPELPIQHLNSSSESPGRPPPSMKDYKRPEDRYNDPWERPRHTEEREHYGRHGYQGEKSRHHERERKHERGYEDKYRERSRHSGHEDRHGERKKARHHSEDYGNRYKERHRHRRDSDHENSRRSSKDSYS